MSAILTIFLVALAAYLGFALVSDRKKVGTIQDFFLHSENLKMGSYTSTLVSTNLSLGNMVYVCGVLGYFYGWSGVFWVVMTILALGLGFQVVGPQFKNYIEDRGNFGTLHDYLSNAHSCGSKKSALRIKSLAAIISSISLLLAVVIEVHLGTTFLQLVLPIPLPILITAFLILVAGYTAMAGFFTVVRTDVVQAILIFAALLGGVMFFAALPPGLEAQDVGYSADFFYILSGVGWPTIVGLICLGFFWLIATPDTWQRNAASRSLDLSLKGSWLGTALMCAAVAAFAVGGMLIKLIVEPNVPDENSALLSGGFFAFNDIFLVDIDSLSAFAKVGAALIAIGLLMAAISTVDTFFVVIGHILNVDLVLSHQNVGRLDALNAAQNKFVLNRGKLFILASVPVLVLSWILMNSFGWLVDPLSLFFVTYTVQFVVAIPLIVAGWTKAKSCLGTLVQLTLATLITLGIGIWGMNNLASESLYLGLTPASWLALLPTIPIVVGIFVYGFVVARSFIGTAPSEPGSS